MLRKKVLKKILLILGVTIPLILLIYFQITNVNQITKIKYTTDKSNVFFWIVEEDTSVYYIRPIANDYVENLNKDKYFRMLLAQYKFLDYSSNKSYNFLNLSISEHPLGYNYSGSNKYTYDLRINSKGRVVANVYYPKEKIGGYSFNLSKNDFKMIKNIVGNISLKDLDQNYFTKNNNSYLAASIDDKYIINNFNSYRSNLDVNALFMYSNYLIMKYIRKLKSNNSEYIINSSKYVMQILPEPIEVI